jgi:hypothetical protein
LIALTTIFYAFAMNLQRIVLLLVTAAFTASTPSMRAQTSKAPLTQEGVSNLQGTWNFSTVTPLERPVEFAGKRTLSKQEAEAYGKQVIEGNNRDNRDPDPLADVAAAYNDVWYDRGTTVAMVNGEYLTSLITDPPDGRLPPLTTAAAARVAARAEARRLHPADGPEDRPLAERCLMFNAGPPLLPGPYNNYLQIFQTEDHVAILNEMIHDARIVSLDRRPHAPSSIRRWQGDPRGRWEGKTLVVDTTNFTDKTNFRGTGENFHLIERFTRVDADTLLYEFIVDDPTTFTKPWTAVLPMKRTDDPIFEYACHEANYGLIGVLRGARFEEKKP